MKLFVNKIYFNNMKNIVIIIFLNQIIKGIFINRFKYLQWTIIMR